MPRRLRGGVCGRFTMWFDESVFYQIYPLGYCGCEQENDFGEVRHRFGEIEKRIPQIKELSFLPRSELKRIDDKFLDQYYGK